MFYAGFGGSVDALARIGDVSVMHGNSLELCAGAGGQAIGLERAGFGHVGLVDNDSNACNTLRLNRPHWSIIETDLNNFDARAYRGIELLAGGLPCPPFSVAGKQLGEKDERNLFPAALRIVNEVAPKAIMIENVRGILDDSFSYYRELIEDRLNSLNYTCGWRLLNAADYGVPQLRPRVVLVAIQKDIADTFAWPETRPVPPTVGETLHGLIAARGWKHADTWRAGANKIAPTIVGGSKKHGGPDLGPTRAKKAWAALGVDGMGIAGSPPDADFEGMPRLTVRMVARLQGFPDNWEISGRKTAAYRQIGNAFPPPVAHAVAANIAAALSSRVRRRARG